MVRDRDSQPEVRKKIEEFARRHPGYVHWRPEETLYDQSAVMTEMAQEAAERGHEWVVPIDPDEIWYTNGRPIRETLGGMSKDTVMVTAELYNHVATAEDPSDKNPFTKIGWRQKFPLSLPKVACRTRPDLVIGHGNHTAKTRGVGLRFGPVLTVRHFPYRTPEQFVEKVRGAWEQLKASDLPASFGVHIRAYGKCLEDEGEEALHNHFRYWFYSPDPGKDDSLMYDPAPI